MPVHSSITHWIRILPNGDREVWQGAPADLPESTPSRISHCGPQCIHGATWWAPLTDERLVAAVAGIEPGAKFDPVLSAQCDYYATNDPCVGVIVREDDEVIVRTEVVDKTNPNNGRPFMARFSWTMGLPWEPPYTARLDDDGVTRIYGQDGKLFASTKNLTPEQAMHELRIDRY